MLHVVIVMLSPQPVKAHVIFFTDFSKKDVSVVKGNFSLSAPISSRYYYFPQVNASQSSAMVQPQGPIFIRSNVPLNLPFAPGANDYFSTRFGPQPQPLSIPPYVMPPVQPPMVTQVQASTLPPPVAATTNSDLNRLADLLATKINTPAPTSENKKNTDSKQQSSLAKVSTGINIAAGLMSIGLVIFALRSVFKIGKTSDTKDDLDSKEALTKRLDEVKSKGIMTTEQYDQLKFVIDQMKNKSNNPFDKITTKGPNSAVLRKILYDLPWEPAPSISVESNYASKLTKSLDEAHLGMAPVKRAIVNFMVEDHHLYQTYGNNIPSHINRPKIICLVGPPGVGKTTIAKIVAQVSNKPFERISLSGVSDANKIRGFESTYTNSQEGIIARAFARAKRPDPVLLFDEIDKMGHNQHHGDPAAALLEVLDPEQNKTFRDTYLDFPYDISRATFICTANDESKIPETLRDRIQIIRMPGYSTQEKIKIAREKTIPRLAKELNWDPKDFRISNDAIQKIIQEYAPELGMRKLEEKLRTIQRNMLVEFQALDHKPASADFKPITVDNLSQYLVNEPRIITNQLEPHNTPGIVQFMYYTSGGSGGGCEPMVVTSTPNVNHNHPGAIIEIGDNFKNHSKLSIRKAFEYINDNYSKLGLPKPNEKIVVNTGTTKDVDGPSLGAASVLAIASCLKKQPVPYNLAMTGAFNFATQKVTQIGGLLEKMNQSYEHGARIFIISPENIQDLHQLPPEILNDSIVLAIPNIKDVLNFGLDQNLRGSFESIKGYINSKKEYSRFVVNPQDIIAKAA